MSLTKVSYSMINGACVNVLDFGAVGDSTTDDTAAIQAAIDYAGQYATKYYGVNVYFPGGQYLVTDTLTINKDYVGLLGEGKGRSLFVRNAAYGDTLVFDNGEIINNNSVRGLSFFHDISFGHGMTGAHINAIATLEFTVDDCGFMNGAYGIILAGGVYVMINNCHLQGQYVSGSATQNSTVGVYLVSTNNTGAVPRPTIVNITNSQINAAISENNKAYRYGMVVNACEEIHVTNCTFNAGPEANVFIQQLADNATILELTFESCFFDTSQDNNVWISGADGDGSNVISRVRFNNCGFNGEFVTPLTGSGIGLFVDGTNRGGIFPQCLINMQITNCTFQAFYSYGLVLNGYDLLLSNNTIYGNNYGNAPNVSGVLLNTNAHRVVVNGNTIGTETGVTAGYQYYGIYVNNGADNFVISDNIVTGNLTAGIVDTSTTTEKRITGNLGFNGNRPATTPALPSSGVDYKNPYGSPAVVSIFNGTVSSVKLNGTKIYSATGVVVNVGANDVLNITYSGTPSWIWWPQ